MPCELQLQCTSIAELSRWYLGHLLDCAGTADLNVPMFIALRRFTLVCTIVLERSLMHKQHDRATIGAVALMIGGKALLSYPASTTKGVQLHSTSEWHG